MKTFISIVAILVAVLCGYIANQYYQAAGTARKDMEAERYKRITTEERLSKAVIKIQSLQKDLATVEKKLAAIETLLEQTKSVNEDLRARLDKIAELKKVLEKKIGELENMSSAF